MIRHDNAYWQRLRKDRRSGAACLLAALAALLATMSLISITVDGTHYEARANPLYWLLMVPMVWWLSGLMGYEPRYVRLWIPAMALASGVSICVAAFSIYATGGWTAETVVCGATLAAAVSSMVAYRGSLLQREGPAR